MIHFKHRAFLALSLVSVLAIANPPPRSDGGFAQTNSPAGTTAPKQRTNEGGDGSFVNVVIPEVVQVEQQETVANTADKESRGEVARTIGYRSASAQRDSTQVMGTGGSNPGVYIPPAASPTSTDPKTCTYSYSVQVCTAPFDLGGGRTGCNAFGWSLVRSGVMLEGEVSGDLYEQSSGTYTDQCTTTGGATCTRSLRISGNGSDRNVNYRCS